MSAAAAPALSPRHIHLPSVHVRGRNGSGFDYDEDIYIRSRKQKSRVKRVIRLVVIENGVEALVRETRDEICAAELAQLRESLPLLMDPGNPEAEAAMEERARFEFARQRRIAAGQERVCLGCGCSDSRACSGQCVWATATLCSRCV